MGCQEREISFRLRIGTIISVLHHCAASEPDQGPFCEAIMGAYDPSFEYDKSKASYLMGCGRNLSSQYKDAIRNADIQVMEKRFRTRISRFQIDEELALKAIIFLAYKDETVPNIIDAYDIESLMRGNGSVELYGFLPVILNAVSEHANRDGAEFSKILDLEHIKSIASECNVTVVRGLSGCHQKSLPVSVSKEQFDRVFSEVAQVNDLGNDGSGFAKLYCLRCGDDGEFDLDDLRDLMLETISSYVFSRLKLKTDSADPKKARSISIKAFSQVYHTPGIDLGDLILHIFIEGELNAPKIMSGTEVKNHLTINGIDKGVYLLKTLEDGFPHYQLVIGVADMGNTLQGNIRKALDCITSLIDMKRKPRAFLNGQVLNSSDFSQEEKDYLKSVIIPSESANTPTFSYGVFIGYPHNMNDWDRSKFQEQAALKLKADMQEATSYIREIFSGKRFVNHSVYFYFLPLKVPSEVASPTFILGENNG